MTQQISKDLIGSFSSSLPPAREMGEFVENSVLVQPDTHANSSSAETIFSCLDCGEEFFYCEPLACGCGGIEFEEVL